ncbi:MAG: arginine--tRNA ligase [Cytophagales bacterium]|nr:arginine--tRNA ligase [Cytophagales bacterium]
MIDLEHHIKAGLSAAFKELYEHEVDASALSLQPTKKEFEGTHTFVVFPYLKVTRQKPEDAGTALGNYLLDHVSQVAAFNVVKGFLNLSLTDSTWTGALQEIFETENYGIASPNGKKVMIEFSSPNTNKPLHLGHLRNNFLGDSVSRILAAAGYDAMKVNLVNDRGIHICKSMLAYQKFGEGETPASSGMKGDHLVGKYYVKFDLEYKAEIKQLMADGQSEEDAKKNAPLLLAAQQLLKDWESGEAKAVGLWKQMNGWVYEGFDTTYGTMGIAFDKTYHESDTYLLGKDIVEEGLEKEIFFKKENGSVWVDLTDEGLDEKLVLRGDGTAVYMTQDMGTCDHKFSDFAFDQSVYTVGNEQDYHFKVLFKIMKRLGRSYADGLYHLSYGMVDLPTGKMKSREGTVVDADDLMEEMFRTAENQTRELGKIEGMTEEEAGQLYKMLGLGALKYFLLKVDPKRRILFNPQESIEFQGNTGPFIQYTHARISALLRRAAQMEVNYDQSIDQQLHSRELDLINVLVQFPGIVQNAASDYSPSLVAQYVYELAKTYNGFYQELPIFAEDAKDQMVLRLMLSTCTANVIKQAMELLGVQVPERM